MRDVENAERFLKAAGKDLKALSGMTDAEMFDTEVFGFHAQQAVEKALKAWLCVCGVDAPAVHDLEELFARVEDEGEDMSQFRRLAYLTDFAVQYRYTAFDDLVQDLDRPQILQEARSLLEHVESTTRQTQ